MDRSHFFDRLAACSRADVDDHSADGKLDALHREASRDLGERISAVGKLYAPEIAAPLRNALETVADTTGEITDRLRRVRAELTQRLVDQRLAHRDEEHQARHRHAAEVVQLMERVDTLEQLLADAVSAEIARRARKPRPRSSAGWLGRARAYTDRQGLSEGTSNPGQVVNMRGASASTLATALGETFGGTPGTTVTIMFAGELPAELQSQDPF